MASASRDVSAYVPAFAVWHPSSNGNRRRVTPFIEVTVTHRADVNNKTISETGVSLTFVDPLTQ